MKLDARVSQIDPGQHGPRFLLHIRKGKYSDGTTKAEQWEMRHAQISLWNTEAVMLQGYVEQVPRALHDQPNDGIFRRECWIVPFSRLGSYP